MRKLFHTFSYAAFSPLANKNQLIVKYDLVLLFYKDLLSEEFFNSIQDVKHQTEFILLIEDEDFDLKRLVNQWSLVKIISFADFISPDWPGNLEIQERINSKFEEKALIKKTFEQKNLLDELIKEQELIISEKTSDIEFSNREQDFKLKRERVVLKFIKDISLSQSYEELLRMIKNEFKVFHELGDIFLIKNIHHEKVSLLSSQSSYLWKEHFQAELKFKCELNFNSIENSTVMANFLSRPFGKLYLFPLSHDCYLGFENQFNENTIKEFFDFFEERKEVIFMAFDKLSSELNLNQFSYRWEKTFDAIKEPIAIIDQNFNVLRSNSAFELNQPSLKCYELFAGIKTICPGCPLVETIEKSQMQKKEIIVNNKNFQLFSYPMLANLNLKSVVHTYRDRTEEKKLYSKLLQTEKMLSIGRLAGHLSHELNNPLTGIRSMVQLLKEQVPAESERFSDLVEIEKATERCFKVLNNFMEFSNPRKVKLESVDISEVVLKTIPLLKVSLRNHLLNLNLNTHKKYIIADPNMLQHVIFNLVNNSTQALKEKGEIRIDTFSKDKKVRLEITDTGEGIPNEIQKFIFEPFFTTKPEGEGTGLGLNIVKNIVENTQGRIFYEANTPRGARFIIEWPIYENTHH